jgi:flagellar hook assembly protein FlgD
LLEVAVAPTGLTPNGDGINDEVAIEATIFVIEGSKRLHVGIFDLGGRRLRDLSLQRLHPSGRHQIPWNGRDAAGRIVPPGIYVLRVGFSTDAGRGGTEVVRLVHVVY